MTREQAREILTLMLKEKRESVSTDTTNADALEIAVESLQEPKMGHWVKKSQYGNDYCSECDYELLMRGKPKFCPNCGTKMESEVRNYETYN